MNTRAFPTEESLFVFNRAREALAGRHGDILTFAHFKRLFPENKDEDIALAIEALASKESRVIEQIYFYDDKNLGLIRIPKFLIKHYIKTGIFYHPVSNYEIEEADNDIIIEFQVL